MKGHTLPGINQRSSEKVDLTKKTGLGPRAEVKKLKEDKGPTEIEMQNTGDFNISNLHKDTKISLDKKKKEKMSKYYKAALKAGATEGVSEAISQSMMNKLMKKK